MFLSLFTTSVLLTGFVHGGQQPLDFVFQSNNSEASTAKKISQNCTEQQLLEDIPCGSQLEHLGHDHSHVTGRWTYPSQCLQDPDTNEEFCVYTSRNFHHNRGISLFTSPAIAEHIENSPAFTSPTPKPNTTLPYEIRVIPNRGNGLFAARTLHRGEPILADLPVGIYQSDAFFPDFPLGYEYLRKTYEQMSEETQKRILRMAKNRDVDGIGGEVMERINTNAFAGEFGGKMCFLLYPDTALMNHDCRPNAMYYHDPATLVHATFASRTIEKGEEITIPYINILAPHSERQSLLQGTWGFQCTCSLCSSSPADIQASDDRMSELQTLQTLLGDYSSSSTATPEMAEKLLELYEKEHVHAAKGTGHMFAALAYNAVGKVKEAKKHAKMAIEAGMVNSGSASREDDVKEMEGVIQRPREHWSYMARKHV